MQANFESKEIISSLVKDNLDYPQSKETIVDTNPKIETAKRKQDSWLKQIEIKHRSPTLTLLNDT